MIAQTMIDVLTGEMIAIESYEHREMLTKDGFTIYDPKKQLVYGKQVNFLADIGASQVDLNGAIDEICDWFSSTLLEAGLAVVSTDREKANGTIVLQEIDTFRRFKKIPGMCFYEVYKIYANGQIRHGFGGNHNANGPSSHYRLASPKPTMYLDNARKSLMNTYKNAILTVLEKYKIKKDKLAKNKK